MNVDVLFLLLIYIYDKNMFHSRVYGLSFLETLISQNKMIQATKTGYEAPRVILFSTTEERRGGGGGERRLGCVKNAILQSGGTRKDW